AKDLVARLVEDEVAETEHVAGKAAVHPSRLAADSVRRLRKTVNRGTISAALSSAAPPTAPALRARIERRGCAPEAKHRDSGVAGTASRGICHYTEKRVAALRVTAGAVDDGRRAGSSKRRRRGQ